MPKQTRIYTRTGDGGTTGLVGGQRVPKNAPRIEAYGTIDELGSTLGLARSALADAMRDPATPEAGRTRAADLDAWLDWVQNALFDLGTDLATLPADRWEGMPLVSAADVSALERSIDRAEGDLTPLDTFILAGGAPAGAYLHLARTVSRRAERLLVSLGEHEEISMDVARFVNRLSDALFVWSRWINAALGRPEHRWNKRAAPPG